MALFALLLGLAQAADATAGQKLYMTHCMSCHGMNADGRGPAAAALKPPPTNFTTAAFWNGRTDEQIEASIRIGKPGTSMTAFGRLTEEDVDNLIAFLRTKAPNP